METVASVEAAESAMAAMEAWAKAEAPEVVGWAAEETARAMVGTAG